MRSAALRSQLSRYSIFIVTTDGLVGPEAEVHLASDYDLRVFQSCDELLAVHKKQPSHAILLDIDTIGDRSEDGIAALAELRAIGPDLVLVALTRSSSRRTRHHAINASVDEYFVAPIDFSEVSIVLNRALEKRAAEIEYRKEQQIEDARQAFHGLIGVSAVMQQVYDAITRVAE